VSVNLVRLGRAPQTVAIESDEGLADAIVEPVLLEPFNPAWSEQFANERDRLLDLLPGRFAAIEHFGSTAVPGLLAKPVIDILTGLSALDDADPLIAPLTVLGYHYPVEFNSTLSDRRWLMRQHRGRRTHHLHLVVFGGPVWLRELHFRDLLRSNRVVAGRYAALKTELATTYSGDREAYTRAKGAFIASILGAAA
jgi:GrpB-like predicted nucleotidyltransferase (UPF0157 family)